MFLGKTVQCDAVQCVLYYTRNKTLLLGTSLYKPYCSEVHLLNQPYLYIGPAVNTIYTNYGFIIFDCMSSQSC